MKKTLSFFILLLAFAGNAYAADAAAKIAGAWKSVENDSITGKPRTLLITEKKLSIDANSADIAIESKDGVIIVRRAGRAVENEPILEAVIISKDKARFTNHIFGEKVFIRTTPEDVKAILAAPSTLKSKADPF